MGIGRMAIILVIDDYAESLDALANIIRNWGHEVITARCEEDASNTANDMLRSMC